MSSERRVVIAVDNSEFSSTALKWAIANFLRTTDYAVVLNSLSYTLPDAMPSVDLASSGEFAVPMVSSDYVSEEKAIEDAKKLVEDYFKLCEMAKIPGEAAVVRGEPGTHIIEWANKISADAIVVGTHGYGVIKRTLLGSISDYVLHHASVPVIIVRSPNKSDDFSTAISGQSRNIVIPVDNSNEAAFAFTWALENICSPSDNVTVLHVQNLSTMPSAITAEDLAMDDIYVPVSVKLSPVQLLGDSEKLIERFMEYAATVTKIHCEGRVVTGSTEEKIVEELEHSKADVVVVGTHDYGAIARTFLGSVSDYLAHNSPCPVVVAKLPKPKKPEPEEGHVHSG